VVLDGLPLYEPFHLRLLLSPVSLLDPRILSGIDVHAGGYTAQYGERMSAVIDAQSVRPEADAYYELGLSLFHVHALASQRWAGGDGQWLVAVRRSNLDEIADLVDSEYGEPTYLDGFARVEYAFGERTRASVQALLASDEADVQNSADTEFASAEYRNAYLWATLEHEFSDALGARAIASWTDVTSERTGEVRDPGNAAGRVADERDYDVLGLRTRRDVEVVAVGTRRGRRGPHAVRGVRLRERSAFRAGLPVPGQPGAGRRLRNRARAVGQPRRPVCDEPLPGDRGARGRGRPALGRADYGPTTSGGRASIWRRRRERACARAGAATSSSRASTSCRSRTASTSSSGRRSPTTQSWGWSRRCRPGRRCASRPIARTTTG
jgi:hypothetical protein